MPDTIYDAGPQGLNRYSYALNNPLRYTDPTGHGVIDSLLYTDWGNQVADSIQTGAEYVKSVNNGLIEADSGAGMMASVAACNSGIDLAASVLSRFFRLGTGTGEWIADPTDYNNIPMFGPVGQNFGTSTGEFIMDPSLETGARFVAASSQVIGTAAGGVLAARVAGPYMAASASKIKATLASERGAFWAGKRKFAVTQKTRTIVYEVVDPKNKRVVYVGQVESAKGTALRLQEHYRKHPTWKQNKYTIRRAKEGNWTPFEAHAYEMEQITRRGGMQSLENIRRPITPKKFNQYKNLHSDYPDNPF